MARKAKQQQTEADAAAGVVVPPSRGELRDLALANVCPDPEQPRQQFDPQEFAELKASLQRDGQREPIEVFEIVPHGALAPIPRAPQYQIVDGERRWRALWDLGELLVWARIVARPESSVDVLLRQLVANAHRAGLTPLEEARAYQRLQDAGLSVGEIAVRISLSVRHVQARLQLLALDEGVLCFLERGEISVSHAVELVGLDANAQCVAARHVVLHDVSVRGLREWLVAQGWRTPAKADGEQTEGSGQTADGSDDDAGDVEHAAALRDAAKDAEAAADELDNGGTLARDPEAVAKDSENADDVAAGQAQNAAEEFGRRCDERALRMAFAALVERFGDEQVRADLFSTLADIAHTSLPESTLVRLGVNPKSMGSCAQLNAALIAAAVVSFCAKPSLCADELSRVFGIERLDVEDAERAAELGVSVEEYRAQQGKKPAKKKRSA